jgi:hypothetical protein
MADKPTTVKEYLDSLTPEERATVEAVRKTFLANLDKDYKEGMHYGMIGYCVPHSVYPAGYHCDPKQPLPFAGFAARKGSTSIAMHFLYGNDDELGRFVEEWKATGKKLDMGKACVRFKRLEDVPLEVVGRAIKRMPVKKYIAMYEGLLAERVGVKKAAKPAEKGTAVKKPAAKRAGKKVAKKTAKR